MKHSDTRLVQSNAAMARENTTMQLCNKTSQVMHSRHVKKEHRKKSCWLFQYEGLRIDAAIPRWMDAAPSSSRTLEARQLLQPPGRLTNVVSCKPKFFWGCFALPSNEQVPFLVEL